VSDSSHVYDLSVAAAWIHMVCLGIVVCSTLFSRMACQHLRGSCPHALVNCGERAMRGYESGMPMLTDK
jgi:hypothetical protein